MRRSVWVLLAILVALIGLALYLENYKPKPGFVPPPQQTPSQFLFTLGEDVIVTGIRIEVVTEEKIIAVERGEDGFWQVIEAPQAEIEQGMIEAAASQVTALRLLAKGLSLSPVDVGVREPAYLVDVTFSDDVEHAFRVGNVTPSGSGYYIQSADGEIAIIDRDGFDSLLTLIKLVQ